MDEQRTRWSWYQEPGILVFSVESGPTICENCSSSDTERWYLFMYSLIHSLNKYYLLNICCGPGFGRDTEGWGSTDPNPCSHEAYSLQAEQGKPENK